MICRHGVDFAEYTVCSECDMEKIEELEKEIEKLEQQLVSARREGWEQGKNEAAATARKCANNKWANLWAAADTIAAMEYGGDEG